MTARKTLGEIFTKPSTKFHRDLDTVEADELMRRDPIDGVIPTGGRDKTTPAPLMAAIPLDVAARSLTLEADKGCDFDYMQTDAGPPAPEPEIH